MELLERFEEHLRQTALRLQTFHPFYEEALNYMLQAGGKRFRPMLLLQVVKAKNSLLIPSALDIAVAIEYLHTYSLIHDDLPAMDNATLRRGRATLHTKFDEVTAILVGDGLNTHAFYLIASAPLREDVKVELTRILAYNGGIFGMVHGQIIDCYFEKKKLGLDELKILHINKTAKLIAASLQMGGVIVDLPYEQQKILYDFGIKLGLLFQIQDDIIDETMSAKEAGKTTNNDKDKNSFVNLLGLEGALEEADRLAKELEEELQKLDSAVAEELSQLLQNYLYRHKGKFDG